MKIINISVRVLVAALLVLAVGTSTFAQDSYKELRSGDQNYLDKDYAKAEQAYRDATVIEPSAKAKFNLGNSLYQQGRYVEAAEEFQQAMNLSSDTMFRAKALYNKGNSLFNEQKYEESVEAYKKSLMLNPDDGDTKKNFMYANQYLQQQQEQQQQEQQEGDESDDEQEQDQQEQQQQDQGEETKEEEELEQDQQQEEQNEENQEPESAPQESDKEMSREEAERLLQVIENADDDVQKKLKKKNSTKKELEKDW